ncbi:MAG: hypothetical protein H6590_03365 [Flavobacteriales bacterium]|nr:hypothetical protein [Flavobacteriales bacterium]MCB9178447.1 hypothetical protein [Flavobacteriales bacterium]
MKRQRTHRTHPDISVDQPRVENASPDPVEGRTDNELWKRHRPAQEAPARAGGDEDVQGAADPRTMEAYEQDPDHKPAPGLLDTTPEGDTTDPDGWNHETHSSNT